jgi:hypothetical protein
MAAINLDATQRAFERLGDTPEGRAALDFLAQALKTFRSRIGTELNEAEFKFVVANLVNQRVPEAKVPSEEVSGYAQFAQTNVFFPERSGFSSTKFVGVNRVLSNGFLIRPEQ